MNGKTRKHFPPSLNPPPKKKKQQQTNKKTKNKKQKTTTTKIQPKFIKIKHLTKKIYLHEDSCKININKYKSASVILNKRGEVNKRRNLIIAENE